MPSVPVIHARAVPVLQAIHAAGQGRVSTARIMALTGQCRSSVEDAIARLLEQDCITREGVNGTRTLYLTARGRGCLGGLVKVKKRKPRRTERTTYSGKARQRDCLMCHRPFPSQGDGNRVCNACKSTEPWQSPAAAQFVTQEVS